MSLPTIVAPRSGLFVVKQPGGLPFVQDVHTHTGNVFFVMTGGTDTAGFGQSPDAPFATWDFAIGQAKPSQGDTIYLMPGHTETISVAGGITNDVTGITTIGLGKAGLRPTITFSAVASTLLVTAANVTIRDIIVTATAAATVMISVTAAGCTLDCVDYVEGSAIPLQFLLTSSAADQLTLKNSNHYGPTAGASAQLWVRLIGCDTPRILDNVFVMTLENGATDAVISGDGSVRGHQVARNTIIQTGGTTQVSAILFTDGATGFAHDNRVAANVTTLAGIVDVGSAGFAAENYALNTADKSGLLDPVEDS